MVLAVMQTLRDSRLEIVKAAAPEIMVVWCVRPLTVNTQPGVTACATVNK